MKRIVRYITPVVLLAIFFGALAANIDVDKAVISTLITPGMDLDERVGNAQDYHKNNFSKRQNLIDLYGITQKLTGKRIIGDLEFVRDDNDKFQHIMPRDEITPECEFIKSIVELDSRAKELGTPFVYLTLPDRTDGFMPVQSGELSAYGNFSCRAAEILKEKQIDCFDLRPLMETEPDAPTLGDYYFKTDGHATTRGEFWSAAELSRYLRDEYGIAFPEYEKVFDLSNYTVNGYSFLGNLGRLTGNYYIGPDTFEIYHPNFPTDLYCFNPYTADDPAYLNEETGSFEYALLNDYENAANELDGIYWITNFGHFESPYYELVNHAAPEGAPDILMISDSIFMRGFSYLALACHRITVADPRYFLGTEYLANILAEEQFDVIVFVGQSASTLSYRSYIDIPDLPVREMITTEEHGSWTADQGMCVGTKFGDDYYDYAKLAEFGYAIPIEESSDYTYIDGWGIDFWYDAPFQRLYMKVGDTYLQCRYAIDHEGMASAYGESLRYTWFNIVLPTSFLIDNSAEDITFIAVSADGEHLYETSYPLIYM